MLKSCEKLYVFLDIDFGRILEGFWEGFGRPKSTIFVIFSIKNASQKWDGLEKAKKTHFGASKANCGRSPADCAGPGEGTKGWGFIGLRLPISEMSVWESEGVDEWRGWWIQMRKEGYIRHASQPFRRRRTCYAQTAAPESKKKKRGNVKACLLHY